MTFGEAVIKMIDGSDNRNKFIRRKSWPYGSILFVNRAEALSFRNLDGDAGAWIPPIDDIIENDWEVVNA